MNIKDIKCIPLQVPLNKPIKTRDGAYMTNIECLAVLLKTNEDIIGHGLAVGIGRHGSLPLITYIEKILGPILLEQHTIHPEHAWNALWLNNRNHLQAGLCLYALAALDIALWDIQGKIENKPLYQLLNTQKPSPIIYGTGGWLSMSNDALLEDCQWYLDRGVNRYKIRIGSDNDQQKLELLRKTFDDKIIFYADANQFYDYDDAMKTATLLSEYDVQWFEEPLFSNSLKKLSQLANEVSIPIATGENFSSHWQFEDLMQLGSVHILQPDIIHCGGITEFIKIASVLPKNTLLTTHLLHELSISCIGLHSNTMVEHLDLFPNDLFTHHFDLKNGTIKIPNLPGTGVNFSNEALKWYQVNDQ